MCKYCHPELDSGSNLTVIPAPLCGTRTTEDIADFSLDISYLVHRTPSELIVFIFSILIAFIFSKGFMAKLTVLNDISKAEAR